MTVMTRGVTPPELPLASTTARISRDPVIFLSRDSPEVFRQLTDRLGNRPAQL